MLKRIIATLAAVPIVAACGASWPEPKQPLVDAESASRSAKEVGAEDQPTAKLQAALADEQIAAAKLEIAEGNHERATYLLLRARADAELALALAREQSAVVERQEALEQATANLNGEIK